MTRAAVLGSPIAHSLSPVLHRAAYAALGLDWTYEAIECREADLPGVLDRPWAGLSLTMPLKRAVLPLLDEVSPLASAVGSANTVLYHSTGSATTAEGQGRRVGVGVRTHVPSERRRRGENTDVYGIVAALAEAGIRGPSTAVILGGGATAASAVAALKELGLRKATLLVRDQGRAAAAAAAADRLGVSVEIAPLVKVPAADLVISTLPAGAADPYAPLVARAAPAVLDVVYAPWPTPLADAVRAAGGVIVGGFAMLLHQAVRQVELMTGRTDVSVEAMRAAGTARLAPAESDI